MKLIVERVAYDIVARNRNIAAVCPHGAHHARVGGNMCPVRIRKRRYTVFHDILVIAQVIVGYFVFRTCEQAERGSIRDIIEGIRLAVLRRECQLVGGGIVRDGFPVAYYCASPRVASLIVDYFVSVAALPEANADLH